MPPIASNNRQPPTSSSRGPSLQQLDVVGELFSGISTHTTTTIITTDTAIENNKRNKKFMTNQKNTNKIRVMRTKMKKKYDSTNLELPSRTTTSHPYTHQTTVARNVMRDAPLVATTTVQVEEWETQGKPTNAAAAANTSLNHSSYTDNSPFQQYLTQIEIDYGVTSIESVGPSVTLEPTKSVELEEEQEVALASSFLPHQPQSQQQQPSCEQNVQSFQNNKNQFHLSCRHDDNDNSNNSHDGSVSDMYAIAVMQYDPAGGKYFEDDDISTLGDESLIRQRRTLWPHNSGSICSSHGTDLQNGNNGGGGNGGSNIVGADDDDDHHPDVAGKPKSLKKQDKNNNNKSSKLSSNKKKRRNDKKTSLPSKSQQGQIDPSKMKEIRINKSKSRSGHTFLQTYFSNSYSNGEEMDANDDNRFTPMSADVYTTPNEFATDNQDEEGGHLTVDDDYSDSFVQRNKWLIIRFVICLSFFLLAISVVALTFGLLYVNDSSFVNGLFGKYSDNESHDFQDNSQDDFFPPAFAPSSVFAPSSNKEASTGVSPLWPDSQQPPLKTPIVPGSTEEKKGIQVHLLSVIADHSPSSLDGLNVQNDNNNDLPATPQSLAYRWMLNDPLYWTRSNTTILQRWVLAVFYYSTDGDEWTTENFPVEHQKGKAPWMNYSNECEWESSNQGDDDGDDACNGDGELYALHVRSVGLKGTIPTELGLLSNLRLFLANDNPGLSGTLPTELGLLSNMEKVQLSLNDLEGIIPAEIGSSWTSLTVAGLANNRLDGTLPTELGLWTNIQTLGLQGNNFQGMLPSEIGRLEKLGETNACWGWGCLIFLQQ
jgi:hypothetical protein